MNRFVAGFFAATAGLEKFINSVLAAFAVYVTTIDAWSEPRRALIVALIGAVQMLYTTNTSKPSPPETPETVGEPDPVAVPAPIYDPRASSDNARADRIARATGLAKPV